MRREIEKYSIYRSFKNDYYLRRTESYHSFLLADFH